MLGAKQRLPVHAATSVCCRSCADSSKQKRCVVVNRGTLDPQTPGRGLLAEAPPEGRVARGDEVELDERRQGEVHHSHHLQPGRHLIGTMCQVPNLLAAARITARMVQCPSLSPSSTAPAVLDSEAASHQGQHVAGVRTLPGTLARSSAGIVSVKLKMCHQLARSTEASTCTRQHTSRSDQSLHIDRGVSKL